jgi:hypothetical protein
MTPIGYLYKRVAICPEGLNAPQVADIYSLSSCVSKDFAYYINFWKHNGFWLFDSPSIIRDIALEHGISLEGLKLFFYEAYELQYDLAHRTWVPYGAEASFTTDIQTPIATRLEGF